MPKPVKKPERKGEQIVAQNRAASYNYHILERLEAGMVLHGTEVKALREGKANIRDAFVDFKPTGPWLVNAHIAQYMSVPTPKTSNPMRKNTTIVTANCIGTFTSKVLIVATTKARTVAIRQRKQDLPRRARVYESNSQHSRRSRHPVADPQR